MAKSAIFSALGSGGRDSFPMFQRLYKVIAASVVGLMLIAGSAVPAGAEVLVADTPSNTSWRTNGITYAVAISGSTTYVGGSFTAVRDRNNVSVARSNL